MARRQWVHCAIALAVGFGAAAADARAGATHTESARLEILGELNRGEFAALERRFEALQDSLDADPTGEVDVRRAYRSFATTRAGTEEALRRWVGASPESYAAHLALATHLSYQGWQARGGKVRSETKDEQFESMNAAFADAVRSASRAIELNPSLSEAYSVAINIAMARGERDTGAALASQALEHRPESYRVRRTVMQSLLPRWGGSYESMARFAVESQKHVDRNPRLQSLLGYPAWDAGRIAVRQKNYGHAVTLFTKAIELGESGEFYATRADALIRMRSYDRALADANEALRLQPEEVSVLADRAMAFAGVGHLDLATADIQLASDLEPDEDQVEYARDFVSSKLVNAGYEQQKRGQYAEALSVLNDAVDLNPSYNMAFYWRGQVHAQKGELQQAEADLTRAIELNPRHIDSYRTLDWVLGKSGRWDEVVAHWNDFIELEPKNATAYLERAGTYRHKGNMPAAIGDLETACKLGNGNACQIIRQAAGAHR